MTSPARSQDPGLRSQDAFLDRVALVTGAASGIGRATAARLAAQGARVFGVDVDEAGLASAQAEIASSGARGELRVARVDLAERAGCVAAVDGAVEAFGGLDILANVAGINRFHHFTEMPEQDWNQMLAVNLSAVVFTCQAAIPHLLARDPAGCIVNVASCAGLQGQAYVAAYCVTKGGVVQLTRALATEYVKTGLRVNALAPGGVDTPMNRKVTFPEDMDFGLVKPYMGHRGFATPEEVADAILYLASPAARFVHGAVLSIDGGVTAG